MTVSIRIRIPIAHQTSTLATSSRKAGKDILPWEIKPIPGTRQSGISGGKNFAFKKFKVIPPPSIRWANILTQCETNASIPQFRQKTLKRRTTPSSGLSFSLQSFLSKTQKLYAFDSHPTNQPEATLQRYRFIAVWLIMSCALTTEKNKKNGVGSRFERESM